MLDPKAFTNALQQAGISFFTGVPDSLLKDICAYITAELPASMHQIATNEGSGIGLAIGHYLATRRPALVYMQNSGLGNTVNPVASLADPLVYGIPMLLMVGWRGEINTNGEQLHDEPQHIQQGRITLRQLETLNIPFEVFDASTLEFESRLAALYSCAVERSGPVAIVIRKQTFTSYILGPKVKADLPTREAAIQAMIEVLPADTPVVATTGMASRELFECRRACKQGHQRDFLTVGGMGHASQIATGIAMNRQGGKVVCLDGDGAILMHLGGLATASRQHNLVHIVINNGAHDSVGGQPTLATELSLAAIAQPLGYSLTTVASSLDEFRHALQDALAHSGSAFIEVRCRTGARADLGRPDTPPADNKRIFMDFLTQGAHGQLQ